MATTMDKAMKVLKKRTQLSFPVFISGYGMANLNPSDSPHAEEPLYLLMQLENKLSKGKKVVSFSGLDEILLQNYCHFFTQSIERIMSLKVS